MNPNLIQRYYKALAGLLGPAVLLFLTDLPDGVTRGEWLAIAGVALGSAGIVAVAPSNKPKGR